MTRSARTGALDRTRSGEPVTNSKSGRTERFLAEILDDGQPAAPDLLPLFDSGEANGLLFYFMRLWKARSLRAMLNRERKKLGSPCKPNYDKAVSSFAKLEEIGPRSRGPTIRS